MAKKRKNSGQRRGRFGHTSRTAEEHAERRAVRKNYNSAHLLKVRQKYRKLFRLGLVPYDSPFYLD